jgi:ketosteroid isomerase-like protein
MQPNSPEEICSLFQQYMAEGDLELVLSVYDRDAVFLDESREVSSGIEELREEFAPFVAAKSRFDFDIRQIIQAGDIALMHTHWTISGPQSRQVYAIEVARRQTDGSWRWLIGDPFTVGREFPSEK